MAQVDPAELDQAKWRTAWSEAADKGYFSELMPKELSGGGLSAASFSKEMIEFGKSYRDNGLTMGVCSHVWTVQQPLVKFGTEEQKSKFLPDLMSGQSIGSFAMTEPEAGSDALALKTIAVRSGEGYVLNGRKRYIGMGPECDLAIVFASTAPEKKTWGISAFLVEATDEGFVRELSEHKHGLKTLPFGSLEFRDCWVPETRRLGREGAGASIFQATLDWERCFILAPHVGAMERQLADCADYCNRREAFDQKIGEFQSVANRLADMRVRLETSRLMLMRAAELYDNGAPLTQFAAMTNLHISEAFLASSLDAFRNFGGAGFMADHPASVNLADSVGGVIYSGTSDVQRQIVATIAKQQSRKQNQQD